MDEANAALTGLLQKHNRKFAVKSKSDEDAYMKLDSSIRLDYVFTRREQRTGAVKKMQFENTLIQKILLLSCW